MPEHFMMLFDPRMALATALNITEETVNGSFGKM
jgi:hypothetical protein